MKNYCKTIFSLNRYKGISCNSIKDAELVFETENIGGVNEFCNGNYELRVYQNGELADYCINGWSFSCICKGYYHMLGTYESLSLDVEACAPDGKSNVFQIGIKGTDKYETEAASLYMSTVMIVSLCSSLDDAVILYKILQEGLNLSDLKDSFNKLKVIKNILEKSKENKELPDLWKQSVESKYTNMYNDFIENVSKEELIKLLLD